MDRIISYIKKNNMIEKGDGIVVGLSGGADSVCLLRALCMLKDEYLLKLIAVHIHHGIRGEEADRDLEFSQKLAEALGVDFIAFHKDIPRIAKDTGLSLEEAGRHERYDCFNAVLKERGFDKIAVAHHKNDLCETMLFNMARGTSVSGLCSIRPVSGNIIRPLLAVSRKDIEDILYRISEDYVTDNTNLDPTYSRNRIRLNIVPELCALNERAVEHIAALSERIGEMRDHIEKEVDITIDRCVTYEKAVAYVNIEGLSKLDSFITKEVLRRVLFNIAHTKKDIASVHIEALYGLLELSSGSKISLPYGMIAEKEYEKLRISKPDEKSETNQGPGRIVIEDCTLSLDELKAKGLLSKNNYTKYFDCDKIMSNVVLGYPRPDSRLVIDAKGHSKRLGRFFIDQKLPGHLRDLIPVVYDGDDVLWVIGYRTSEAYRIDENTKKIISISYIEDDD